MTAARYRDLILAVHPTTRGFGWVIFETPHSVVDWGMASAKAGRNSRLTRRFERILRRYQPQVLVLEPCDRHATDRARRSGHLCRSLADLARWDGMTVYFYQRAAIRTVFATVGATTRYEIAQAIARRLSEFREKLPPERKPGMAQHRRQALFDAAALAITHFAVRGDNASP